MTLELSFKAGDPIYHPRYGNGSIIEIGKWNSNRRDYPLRIKFHSSNCVQTMYGEVVLSAMKNSKIPTSSTTERFLNWRRAQGLPAGAEEIRQQFAQDRIRQQLAKPEALPMPKSDLRRGPMPQARRDALKATMQKKLASGWRPGRRYSAYQPPIEYQQFWNALKTTAGFSMTELEQMMRDHVAVCERRKANAAQRKA